MSGPMTAARRVLGETFGFNGFRPGQEAVIGALLAGRSALVVMPTGSGKSLCFQIPGLVMDGLTVVVSPLVALMQDQIAALRLMGIEAESINSGNSRGGECGRLEARGGGPHAVSLHGPGTADDRAHAGGPENDCR